MRSISPRSGLASLLAGLGLVAVLIADEPRPASTPAPARWRQHDIARPRPPVVEPPGAGPIAKPPADAVILFDGTSLDAWKGRDGKPSRWKVADGAMETVPGAGMVETKGQFGDIQLHIEWAAPKEPNGKGQDRGNSGLFLMGQFEVQILDSYRADTYADGQAGAIYGQYPPLANASRPPGEWQAYDIAFRRPRFDGSGRLLEPARITVLHNGILVQNNEEPFGPTSWLKWLPYEHKGDRGPIALQDHDHPVRFRNIWLRELPERAAPAPRNLMLPAVASLTAEDLDRFAGDYRMGGSKVAIRRDGNHLTIAFPFLPRALELMPSSGTEFFLPFTDGEFTFRKDDAGKVTGAHFRIGDGERDLKKIEP